MSTQDGDVDVYALLGAIVCVPMCVGVALEVFAPGPFAHALSLVGVPSFLLWWLLFGEGRERCGYLFSAGCGSVFLLLGIAKPLLSLGKIAPVVTAVGVYLLLVSIYNLAKISKRITTIDLPEIDWSKGIEIQFPDWVTYVVIGVMGLTGIGVVWEWSHGGNGTVPPQKDQKAIAQAAPPGNRANRETASTTVRQWFAGTVRIPIKAYVVKANKEVLYLPHVDVRFARKADVTRIIDAEEEAIRQKQDELDRKAIPHLDLLIKYVNDKQERNAESVKDNLRSLSKDWRANCDPNRVFDKLPKPEKIVTTNDKGRCTAELPADDWFVWASTSRMLPSGEEEKYRWLLPVPESKEVDLTERNLYTRPWHRAADWVDRF